MRALDPFGISYAINPIPVIGTPTTHQLQFAEPTSEEEQRMYFESMELFHCFDYLFCMLFILHFTELEFV